MADKGRGRTGAPPSPIYGLGILGGWVWFWQQADGFWWHVLAVLEGLIWPAFVVYHALRALD